MARELKPCGTHAAYRRHLRAGEQPCEPCRAAAREQKNARKQAQREAAAAEAQAAVPAVTDEVDRRQVLLEVLAVLRGQLATAPPQSVAAIAKQVRDTVNELEGPGEQAAEQLSPIDEIAKRREARLKARRSM